MEDVQLSKRIHCAIQSEYGNGANDSGIKLAKETTEEI
jgi:hypothetical protein